MTKIKVVAFDLWLTLIGPNSKSHMARAQILARAFGIEATEEFSQLVRSVSKELDIRSEETGKDFGCGDRIDLLAEKLGRPARKPAQRALLVSLCQSSIRKNQPHLLNPEDLETLRVLKEEKGMKLVLVSNTGYPEAPVMREVVENLGLAQYFDLMLFSSEMGVAKPSPDVYKRMCDHFGVEPEEILQVGDSRKADFEGPRAYGMRSLLFSPKEPAVEHERISSLKEVLGYLNDLEPVTRLALYEVTEDAGVIVSTNREGFCPSDYSRLKHGDAKALARYGYELADFFFDRFKEDLYGEPQQFIIAPFAYMHVQTAAANMMEWFHERLGARLRAAGLPNLEQMHIFKYVSSHSQDHNYARVSIEERAKILSATKLSIDRERLKGKTLVIIDDAFITGSSERKVLETVRGVGAREIVTLYILRMDERVASTDPGVESRINQTHIKRLDDLVPIFQPGAYRVNLRNCKFILESDPADVARFVAALDPSVVRALYLNCIANSYYLEPAYEHTIACLEAELVRHGLFQDFDAEESDRDEKTAAIAL